MRKPTAAAARRTSSYKTRRDPSNERKLTTMMSAVNMDIDSHKYEPSASSSSTVIGSGSGAAPTRSYKRYGEPRAGADKSALQRSQTQKLWRDYDDPSKGVTAETDNRRQLIQDVIRKYAQYDDNKYKPTTNLTKPSASSAHLAAAQRDHYGDYGDSSRLYGTSASGVGGHRNLTQQHNNHNPYGINPSSSFSYHPRDYSTAALGYSAAAVGKSNYGALPKKHELSSYYNSINLGGYPGVGQYPSAAEQRSRKNLLSFVRILYSI